MSILIPGLTNIHRFNSPKDRANMKMVNTYLNTKFTQIFTLRLTTFDLKNVSTVWLFTLARLKYGVRHQSLDCQMGRLYVGDDMRAGRLHLLVYSFMLSRFISAACFAVIFFLQDYTNGLYE